ncbi:MAG: type II toxin-antitoxin system RelE/ParE family toxin [Myxococcales bacterium]
MCSGIRPRHTPRATSGFGDGWTRGAAAQQRFEPDKNLAALGFCSLSLIRWPDGRGSPPRNGSEPQVVLLRLARSNASRYYPCVIRSFRDAHAERLFKRQRIRRVPPDLQRIALRKLVMLDAATSLLDLRIPPANRLEKLDGDRNGQHSNRINDQWRIYFRWLGTDAHDVEIVDYH